MQHLVKALLVLFVLSGCEEVWDCQKGEGPIVVDTLILDDFHSLTLSGSGQVRLRQGSQQEVRVEGQQNIIDNLNTRVRDGRWDIRFLDCTRSHKELTYYITIPDIRALEISGSGVMIGENTWNVSDLGIDISGSGSFSAEVNATSLDMDINGSGTISLAGESERADLTSSGSGALKAFSLLVTDYTIKISGSGNADVTALENLDVDISGSGDVSYKGNPLINSSISGSGKIRNRN